MSSLIFAVLGFVGAFAILLAYVQVSRHAWKPGSLLFQLANLLGAGLLIVYSLHLSAWPNVLLNGVWLVVALLALARIKRK